LRAPAPSVGLSRIGPYDPSSSLAGNLDEPLGMEVAQRLADGRPAYAKLRRELCLTDAHARRERAVEDLAPQLAGDERDRLPSQSAAVFGSKIGVIWHRKWPFEGEKDPSRRNRRRQGLDSAALELGGSHPSSVALAVEEERRGAPEA